MPCIRVGEEAGLLTPFQARAARALSQAPLFGELAPEELCRLRRTAVRRGDLLFAKGDPSEHLFGLISGRLKVFSPLEPDREVALDLVAPGEILGELGLEQGAPRFAGARALAPSELASLPRAELEALLARRPELRGSLERASVAHAERLAQHSADLAFLTLERRLEKVLLDLAARFGEAVEQGVRVPLRQQELAEVVGVSRESVSRALASPGLRDRFALGRGSITLRR